MIAFAYDTPNRTLALIKRLGITCDARQNGTLRAAYSARAALGVEATARQCIARGMPVTLLDRAAVAEATGSDRYVTAMLDSRGGDVNPLAYSRGLARAAMAAGASVYGRTPVRSLARTSKGWLLGTSNGNVNAEKILIATNGFTDDLRDGLKRTIIPVFSAIAASEPFKPGLGRKILPGRSSVYESGRITVYYRIDAQGRLLMGGRGPMRPIAGPQEIAYLTDYAQRLWPELSDVRWTLWLEQPACYHEGSLAARSRACGECTRLCRLQRPRRGARHGDR